MFNLPYQYEVREMIKYNDKIEKELGGTYLWDFETVAAIILTNMKEEAHMNQLYNYQLAHFIALRLKFADDKTIHLMKEALFHNRKYYNETIDGVGPIYEAMQEGLDYYSALFSVYSKTAHAQNSKLPFRIKMVDTGPIHNFHHRYLHPTEDGRHLVELSAEEYHEKYGLTNYEKINQEPSEEWKREFDRFNKFFDEEKEKREKMYKKAFRKWSQKQRDEFGDFIESKRKDFNL